MIGDCFFVTLHAHVQDAEGVTSSNEQVKIRTTDTGSATMSTSPVSGMRERMPEPPRSSAEYKHSIDIYRSSKRRPSSYCTQFQRQHGHDAPPNVFRRVSNTSSPRLLVTSAMMTVNSLELLPTSCVSGGHREEVRRSDHHARVTQSQPSGSSCTTKARNKTAQGSTPGEPK